MDLKVYHVTGWCQKGTDCAWKVDRHQIAVDGEVALGIVAKSILKDPDTTAVLNYEELP